MIFIFDLGPAFSCNPVTEGQCSCGPKSGQATGTGTAVTTPQFLFSALSLPALSAFSSAWHPQTAPPASSQDSFPVADESHVRGIGVEVEWR